MSCKLILTQLIDMIIGILQFCNIILHNFRFYTNVSWKSSEYDDNNSILSRRLNTVLNFAPRLLQPRASILLV